MPQMAPLLWLYLYIFFLLSFIIFLMINYFIKPFETIDSNIISKSSTHFFNWKL
ncbi:ATP synthase F0 subunit 8 (mitochondrion) [Portunus trituberculatus]|uniref:ATP synthase F0 subunit 8 n=1 Tax=Portunus trituberculatus TaxID=210409 RepID=Q7Y8W9_PORTR|nr:ATP synthase F0 subunit 8 [Portunus trituberculatus]QPD06753.1 ATP synthase F0 subunit 8 [Portunus trituberculatus]QPF22848.1 ATP synthase F0 subunit 8 [Portunus trituberculatus]BAC79208.1 ATPase subunit 8 [Portunus trituberculatus]